MHFRDAPDNCKHIANLTKALPNVQKTAQTITLQHQLYYGTDINFSSPLHPRNLLIHLSLLHTAEISIKQSKMTAALYVRACNIYLHKFTLNKPRTLQIATCYCDIWTIIDFVFSKTILTLPKSANNAMGT